MEHQFKFKANRPKTKKNTDIKSYSRVIEDIISKSDIILEILDSRIPNLSKNNEIEELAKQLNKKVIFILNKADLINPKDLKRKLKDLKKQNKTFAVSSKERTGTKRLREYLFALGKKSTELKIGVLGYPNTGKSSLINSLAKRKKTKVTSWAGTTHGQQYVKLHKNILIIDSPGIIPIKENDELRQALIASKNVEKIKNLGLVAHTIINIFYDKEPIEKLYNIKINSKDPEKIIEQIAIKRGFLQKGNQIDEKRAETQIIRDWQTGKLNEK